MPENQNYTGERWTKESIAILRQLGWTQKGSSNFDIECSLHTKERRGHKHGIDSFFSYYDPYYQSQQGILVESKNWQFDNITDTNIKKWIRQMTDCMECMQTAPTIQDLSQAPIQNALLICWANDKYEHLKFMERLKKVGIASKKYPCNIFVASNFQILKWCSLIDMINKIKQNAIHLKFIYPNVPTLGTDLVKADHLTLTHLYSKYIFAEVIIEANNFSGGTERYNKLIVFCYEEVTNASLDFLYDLIKRLNFQSYRMCEIYLHQKEETIRQTVADFNSRIKKTIKGDVSQPFEVDIKYLDDFSGMHAVPDNIIRFEEVE